MSDPTRPPPLEGDYLAPGERFEDVHPMLHGTGKLVVGTMLGAVLGYFLNPIVTETLDRMTGRDGGYEFEDEGE